MAVAENEVEPQMAIETGNMMIHHWKTGGAIFPCKCIWLELRFNPQKNDHPHPTMVMAYGENVALSFEACDFGAV